MSDAAHAALQAQFGRDGLQRCRRGAAIFCAFAAALLILSAAYSALAEPALFADLLRVRLVGLGAVAAIAALLATPLGARRPRELTLALMAAMSVCMHLLAQYTGGQLSPQYDRLNLVLLAPAVLMSWNAGWSLLGCATVIGTYLGGSVATGALAAPAFSASLGRLLAASLVTVGANVARERIRRRELWHVHALRAAREHAEAEIRRLNAELEERVLERTAALRASDARFRAMFEAAPIAVLTLDASGRLLQCNRAFAALVAADAGELLGRPLTDLAAADDHARSARGLAELCERGRTSLSVDIRFVRADGAAIATHGALAAIRDEAGSFLCALGMFEDVSERLRAEEQAHALQDRLAHVQRVTTMGGMLAELAHELNQPLGAIVNFANGTRARLQQSGADPVLADAVGRIASEAMRAAEIIRRVREFVRPGGAPTTRVDLNSLVRTAAELVESDAERHHIPIRLHLDPTLPAMRLDGIQVEQVLLNLFRNAIEAMRESPRPDHELVVQTLAAAGAGVEVRVRDTGVGIPADASARIFEAFFTTKPGGLGMGLSISRSIIEAYGGQLWARGNPDRGMTFAFSLPRNTADDAGVYSRSIPADSSGWTEQ